MLLDGISFVPDARKSFNLHGGKENDTLTVRLVLFRNNRGIWKKKYK